MSSSTIMEDERQTEGYGTKRPTLFGWWKIGHISITDLPSTFPNIVSATMLFVYSTIVPIAVAILVFGVRMVMMRMVGRRGNVEVLAACLRDLHHFVKPNGSSPPDFLDRCKYSPTLALCTGNPAEIEDGRKSFPSGHASYSFAGCTFLTLSLLSLLNVWPIITTSRHFHLTPTRKTDYPYVGGLQQYIHHPTDVIAGSLLGILVAVAVHYSRIPDSLPVVLEDLDGERE
ncbi:hypothetical protein BC829DRAFT_380826 [Chytridium lagenaria]|nr:hypothetical protein BC829DRAFT_380826 [Chytridium lagenaria]